MTIDGAPAASSADVSTAGSAVPSTAPPSRPWRLAALLLAGAAQLITISALVSVDPIAVTWASLLLAIAPAPLAAVALYAPVPVDRLASVAAAAVLVAGIAGQITHTGLFFLPALVVLAIGCVELWREHAGLAFIRPGARRSGRG